MSGSLGVVLTCKEALAHYCAKFGFADNGLALVTPVCDQMAGLNRLSGSGTPLPLFAFN